MTYNQAISYLYSLREERIDLGLPRIKKLLSFLKVSIKNLKVIHIAGSNGKGSVAAMVSNILAAGGYKAGVYTSPHLYDFRERIAIKSVHSRQSTVHSKKTRKIVTEEIPKKTLVELVKKIRPLIKKVEGVGLGRLTFFEVTTAIMFAYFVSEKVDFAVLEVGLGGRLDATNIVKPLVSVITSISLEHTDRLGDTIEKIAKEKSGIIKRNCPVITICRDERTLKVIKSACRRNNSRLIRVKESGKKTIKRLNSGVVYYKYGSFRGGVQFFDYYGIKNILREVELPLLGRYQLTNASCAMAVIELLSAVNCLPLTVYHIKQGLISVKWPARLEIIGRHPTIVFDGAHNPEASAALAKAMRMYFNYRKLILITGFLKDKDFGSIFNNIFSLADKIFLTTPGSPRAIKPRDLLKKMPLREHNDVFVISDAGKAIKKAVETAGKDDLVLIAGSFYLAAAARNIAGIIKN